VIKRVLRELPGIRPAPHHKPTHRTHPETRPAQRRHQHEHSRHRVSAPSRHRVQRQSTPTFVSVQRHERAPATTQPRQVHHVVRPNVRTRATPVTRQQHHATPHYSLVRHPPKHPKHQGRTNPKTNRHHKKRRPHAFGQVQNFVRPGSPALLLALVVLVCVLGTALIVSLTRRRGPKPTS
jgi:hypothetical protein